jgi:UDP-N-acetylglucosamine:LPS N-acetylglucosamine transferase
MQNNKCILLITSSFPSNSNDIAGAFILDYIEEFKKQNVNVTVLTQANNKEVKITDEQTDVIRFPWRNQSNEPLAYFSFSNLINIFFLIFAGVKYTRDILNEKKIDAILCLWIIPSGLYVYLLKLFYRKKFKTPYLVWALGSDIWKIRIKKSNY